MKISRTISIVLYAVVFLIIGSFIYRSLFASGGGRSGGFSYGNLFINYSVEERGVLSPKVPWLIATPEMPTNQSYQGDADQFTFAFVNGKTYTLRPDSKNLVWIDPTTGPITVPTDLTAELVQRIKQTRELAQGQAFRSGTELLTWLDKTTAEQDGGGQPANRAESK